VARHTGSSGAQNPHNGARAYDLDIRPLGFRNVEMNGFLTQANVDDTRRLLDDPDRVNDWAEVNFQLGLRHFSYAVVRRELRAALSEL
jgi:hypothetical protein